MSESDRDISIVGVDADDQEDVVVGVGGGGGFHGNDNGKKQRGYCYGLVCTGNFRKAKQLVLFPVAKAKKQLYNTKQRLQNKKLSSAAAAKASLSGNTCGGTTGKRCSFCFTQPQTLDSPAESLTSDPNDPTFSYEMLKSLIEKNDFYSKECNPHLNFHG